MPEPDLAALAIQLSATRSTRLTQHMGRAVHALFFRLIGEPLATAIHPTTNEASDREMPFTVSGLLRPGSSDPLFGDVQVGDAAWIRITGLSAEVVAALDCRRDLLVRALRRSKHLCLDIDHLPWAITRVGWDDQALPGLFSYSS